MAADCSRCPLISKDLELDRFTRIRASYKSEIQLVD